MRISKYRGVVVTAIVCGGLLLPLRSVALADAAKTGDASSSAGTGLGAGTSQPYGTPQAKTEAAVIAADDGWSAAEDNGDVAYVDQLLLPSYRSVNPDGSVHDKAAILAGVKKAIGSNQRAIDSAKWRAAHPHGTTVVMQGDTAILTFYLKALGPVKGVLSSDIFVYSDQRWHAIYSQHSDAGK